MARASLPSGATRKEMLPHCVQQPGAWPQPKEVSYGNNILRATQAKAHGLEQGSRPGDTGGGTKGVRMNDSNPGAGGPGWYAGLCAAAASRVSTGDSPWRVVSTRFALAHQTPSAAHPTVKAFFT